MKKLLIILIFFTSVASAQKLPDYGFNKIRIVGNEKIIQAELIPITSEPDLHNDRIYYWSSSNAIHSTQGGFSGKLLNGEYAEYYANKNLKERGRFNKGLKTGIWKSWNEQGVLLQMYTWNNGVLSGEFELFKEDGIRRQSGTYKQNLLNGMITTYLPSNKTEVLNYKNGVPEENKKKSKLLNKLNFLKKTKRDTTQLQR